MTQENDRPEQVAVEPEEQDQRADLSDLQDTVDDLIVHLHEAKNVPLSGNAMVDRELFLSLLEKVRADLPDELRAARWMVREREAFIARTNEKAREIVDRARNEADELVSDSSIVAEAVEEANILVRRAEGEARLLRLETEDEIEKNLQRVETILNEVMNQIQSARDELHQARPKPPDVPI
jgi:vacuolar-type H+-ATPase subunit H